MAAIQGSSVSLELSPELSHPSVTGIASTAMCEEWKKGRNSDEPIDRTEMRKQPKGKRGRT